MNNNNFQEKLLKILMNTVFLPNFDYDSLTPIQKELIDQAQAAINELIKEVLGENYILTPWKNADELPDHNQKIGQNQFRQALLTAFGLDEGREK